MAETYREIVSIRKLEDWLYHPPTKKERSPRWLVIYKVRGSNGRELGQWQRGLNAPDEGGAALKMLEVWMKADARNARRRELKEQRSAK